MKITVNELVKSTEGLDKEDAKEVKGHLDAYNAESIFESATGAEWIFLTDEDADELVAERIEQEVWAFTPSFLAAHCGIPEEMFAALSEKCEGANEPFLTCIKRAPGGLGGFVDEAISVDGRGHFLNPWDGQEHEFAWKGVTYYGYRVN